MIPIIVIAESGESFNYFLGLRKGEIEGEEFSEYRIEDSTGEYLWRTPLEWLRDKVLKLLHEEASELCYENTIGCIIPACFQIHIKDIIEKAKGVTPNA